MATLTCGPLWAQAAEESESFLVRWLRLRPSSSEVAVRYLLYIGIAVMLGLAVWYAHRKFASPQRRSSSRRRSRGSMQRWGLDPQERDFVSHVAEQDGGRDPDGEVRAW